MLKVSSHIFILDNRKRMGWCDDDVSANFCRCTRCALVHFYNAAQTVDLKMTLSMKTEGENF